MNNLKVIKNKKGFLLGEETLKIVLAVICIGFLIYFLVALYYGGFGDKDLKLAKASVKHLVDELNAGATEIEIYNPEKWYILNLPKDSEWICICEGVDKCDPDENCAKPKEPIEVQGVLPESTSIYIPRDSEGDRKNLLPITLKLNNGVLSLK